jgi:hypothetical protein
MTAAEADGLVTVRDHAAATVLTADPVTIPIVARLTGMTVHESTPIRWPRTLAQMWVGRGKHHTTDHDAAAVNLGGRLQVTAGGLIGPPRDHALTSDHRLPMPQTPAAAGTRSRADRGFFDRPVRAPISAAGGWWVRRLPPTTASFSAEGERLDLRTLREAAGPQPVDRPIQLGVPARVPARQFALPVPQAVVDQRRRRRRAAAARRGRTVTARSVARAAWTRLVTTGPVDRLAVDEALGRPRARWHIERLFKRWQSHGPMDTGRSGRAAAIRCALDATVIGMVCNTGFIWCVAGICPSAA